LKNQRNIVIIPARGGSKRLPRKNVLPLDGKPLIQHTIDFAKNNLELLHRIIVTTDDREIKDIAKKNEVEVINRPDALSGDTITTAAVLKHAAEEIAYDFDNIILLQVTNPLRPEELLKNTLSAFHEGDYDSLMTVTRDHQKLGKIINNTFVPFNYQFGQRSQDMEPLYFENGLLYISHASVIKKERIMGDKMLPYIVDHPYAAIDIDEEKDLLMAKFIIHNKRD